MADYGELTGTLTLAVGGQVIDLGTVRIPVAAQITGDHLTLTADIENIRTYVRAAFGGAHDD